MNYDMQSEPGVTYRLDQDLIYSLLHIINPHSVVGLEYLIVV
jgi:hypothetical protein